MLKEKKHSKHCAGLLCLFMTFYGCGGPNGAQQLKRETQRTLPVVTFSTNEFSAQEGSVVSISIKVTGDVKDPVKLTVKTRDGLAKENVDFPAVLEQLEFNEGGKIKDLRIELFDDTFFETDKFFYVDITSVMNATVIDSSAIVRVINDDPKVKFQMLDLITGELIENGGRVLAGATALDIQDYDGDGTLDLAVASYAEGQIQLFERNELASEIWNKKVILEGKSQSVFVQSFDFENDGDFDLISTAFGGNEVSILLNDGKLNDETDWRLLPLDKDLRGPISARTGDINGDSVVDFIAAAYWDHSIFWYERNTNTAALHWDRHVVDDAADRTHDIFVADLNGDNRADIASANFGGNSITIYQNEVGDASGWYKVIVDDQIQGPTSLVVSDLNSDGSSEIVATSYLGDYVALYSSVDGDIEIWKKQMIAENIDAPFDLEVGDLDQDGDLDIVVASYLAVKDQEDGITNAYTFIENTSLNSSWKVRTLLSSEYGAHEISLKDFDGNGFLDILAATPSQNTIKLFKAEANKPN